MFLHRLGFWRGIRSSRQLFSKTQCCRRSSQMPLRADPRSLWFPAVALEGSAVDGAARQGGAGTGLRGNPAHPAPRPQGFVLGSPASTSWALPCPAQASRITSLLGLLCYTFTLFFDYRSLLCAIIVDTDRILAGVSISHWLPFPQAWVCSPWKPLVSYSYIQREAACWNFVCVRCLSLAAFVFVGLRAYLSLSRGDVMTFLSDCTSVRYENWIRKM